MSENLFLREIEYYQRHLNPIRDYLQSGAYFLSKTTGAPIEETREYMVHSLKTKRWKDTRDPIVRYFVRHNYEDEVATSSSMSEYIMSVVREDLIMAPSMTCYVNPKEKESILVGFTDENARLRGIAKKKSQEYKAKGEMVLYQIYNGEQENKKMYNNSMSGAFSSRGSIIRNPTAHSSLTSTTRVLTSIGNASNERIISGNRHYRDYDITLNNVVILAMHVNVEEVESAIREFGLIYPSVDQVMECIEHSTEFYWKDIRGMANIRDFVSKCTPTERANIVYNNDLYHIRKFNPHVVREFITTLSTKVTSKQFDDPLAIIAKTNEMIVNYTHQICQTEVRGIGKDYSKISKQSQCIVAATCINIENTIRHYQNFIRAFFLTKNLPVSVAYIKDMLRRTAVLSDTDSTMFSCDEWVDWYYGDIIFTEEAFAVSGSVMFLATECIAHNLALYSANLNVERDKLFKAAMKPEFVFPIFALTSNAKHYYTYTMIKEGSVYSKLEKEIKGVHLKNSASPRILIEDAQKMMTDILDTAMRGEKVSMVDSIQRIVGWEIAIKESIYKGEDTFLGRLNLKAHDAYGEGPETSNYRHHTFWNQVFGPKYGMMPEPPYTVMKFPTTLETRRLMNEWIASLEDRELADRFTNWLAATGRTELPTVYVSQDYIQANGVPPEVISMVDMQRMILDHTKTFRMVLESIGEFTKRGMTLTDIGYVPLLNSAGPNILDVSSSLSV